MLTPLNEQEQRRHKRRNRAQSLLLLGGMVALLSACGWVLGGPQGVFWALIAGGLSLLFSPRLSPKLVLRLYRARPLHPTELPTVYQVLTCVCKRAGLGQVPALYYVPSRMLNAFSVGQSQEATIALTDGLLRHLTMRELAGVIAHEVSHVRNRDLWIMGLADAIGRLTSVMSFFGMILLVINLPLLLVGEAEGVPWLLIPLLILAPTIGSMLQLALSRTREFEADLDAAGITGDPRGLASALAKLQRFQGGLLETLFLPGRRLPDPSLLRTHPSTEERIRRLLSLERRPDTLGRELERIGGSAPAISAARRPASIWPPPPRPPRWHVSGLWH
jgi:heat shock protein HtpX